MAKLIYVPLGCSLRSQLAEKLSRQPLGEGVLVLPNRLLTDDVHRNYANVETMGMDTLASKLMNLNGGSDYKDMYKLGEQYLAMGHKICSKTYFELAAAKGCPKAAAKLAEYEA